MAAMHGERLGDWIMTGLTGAVAMLSDFAVLGVPMKPDTLAKLERLSLEMLEITERYRKLASNSRLLPETPSDK